MYILMVCLAGVVMAGAVIYETRRQKALWDQFQKSLERLIGAGSQTCSS
ncbi:MAG: hypothetical protein JRJ59_00625 [Deltaproteobacteria bacterium]|nr:hypothetical protein [Deltaproteobacteria bacterium]